MNQLAFLLSVCLYCIVVGQFNSESEAIAVRTVGFTSKYSQELLQSLIEKADLNLVEQSGPVNVYQRDSMDKCVLIVNDSNTAKSIKYDACLLYLDPLLLQNDELATQRLLDALNSLYEIEDDKSELPTLIVAFSYSDQKHLQKFVKFLTTGMSLHEGAKLNKIVSRVNEALTSPSGTPSSPMAPDFNVRSLYIPFNRQLGKKVVSEFKEFLSSFESQDTSISDAKEGEALTEPVVSVPSNGGNRTVAYYISELGQSQSSTAVAASTNAANAATAATAAPRADYSQFEEYYALGRQLVARAREGLREDPVATESKLTIAPELFRSVVDKHMQGVLSQLREKVKSLHTRASSSNGSSDGGLGEVVISEASLALVQTMMTKELLDMWSPAFKQQLQLHGNQVIRDFNQEFKAVNIGIHIEKDLLLLRDRTVRRLERISQTLIPTVGVLTTDASPTSAVTANTASAVIASEQQLLLSGNSMPEYNAQDFIKSVNHSLSVFVGERIAHYQQMGVAASPTSAYGKGIKLGPFTLPPIELSVHTMLYHPLNLRDYRQDVLTGPESGDELVLRRENQFDLHSGRVTPVTVRKALQKQIQSIERDNAGQGWWGRVKTYFQTRGLREQSEFAREMLMLPLSVRDHKAKLFDNKGRDNENGVNVGGVNGEKNGNEFDARPEQFLKWSMPGLTEARESVKELQRQTRQPTTGPEDGLRGAVVDRWMKTSWSPNKYSDKGVNYNFDPSDAGYKPRRSLFGRVSSMIFKT